MSSCSGNCSTCGSSSCGDRKAESMLASLNPKASVKKVIAVVSGKGGVGKSTVTSMLAVAMARTGRRVGVLDADITGPSAPTAFGVTECQGANEDGLYPALTRSGIQVMSINLLLDDSTAPVVWRGPVIAGAVKQFWTDVIWEDVDYMFVDMPPGTGDVPLTVFQSLPVDGIVIVTSPQDLVSMIVSKAVKMANMMHIPVLALTAASASRCSVRASWIRWLLNLVCLCWLDFLSTPRWLSAMTMASWKPSTRMLWPMCSLPWRKPDGKNEMSALR